MNGDRALRVAIAFAGGSVRSSSDRLCRTCSDLLEVSGAGITLMSGTNSGPVCASNQQAAELDQLQFTLGEGPSRDAFGDGIAVSEPDLSSPSGLRWPTFTPSALRIGVGGVFVFPLHAGTERIGVLSVYQNQAGPLTSDQMEDGLMVAEVVAQTLLTIQSRSRPGVLAEPLRGTGTHRAEVHQASGMMAVQLGISVSDALIRLRAHSYSVDRPLADVAQDVVERRLRLPNDDITPGK